MGWRRLARTARCHDADKSRERQATARFPAPQAAMWGSTVGRMGGESDGGRCRRGCEPSIQLHRVRSRQPTFLALKSVTFHLRHRVRLDRLDAHRLPALRTAERCGGDRRQQLHKAGHAICSPGWDKRISRICPPEAKSTGHASGHIRPSGDVVIGYSYGRRRNCAKLPRPRLPLGPVTPQAPAAPHR
jgi:hypothetical protein